MLEVVLPYLLMVAAAWLVVLTWWVGSHTRVIDQQTDTMRDIANAIARLQERQS